MIPSLSIRQRSFAKKGPTDHPSFGVKWINTLGLNWARLICLEQIIAAFLFAQLSQMNRICEQRLKLWNCYHTLLQPLEEEGLLKRPVIPERCEHNGHIYYIVLPSEDYRDAIMDHLKQNGIQGIFHYVPLHSSPAGMKFGESHGAPASYRRIQ